jgi:hypothetical protein
MDNIDENPHPALVCGKYVPVVDSLRKQSDLII